MHSAGYAKTTTKNKGCIYLHRIVIGALKGQEVDHINGNKLDNRRCNLRIATRGQNEANKPLRQDNQTGYKGVWWDAKRKMFQSYIRIDNRKKFLGRFVHAIDAARAYNQAAHENYGKFARVNEGIK